MVEGRRTSVWDDGDHIEQQERSHRPFEHFIDDGIDRCGLPISDRHFFPLPGSGETLKWAMVVSQTYILVSETSLVYNSRILLAKESSMYNCEKL
jgi:hypothetical protein